MCARLCVYTHSYRAVLVQYLHTCTQVCPQRCPHRCPPSCWHKDTCSQHHPPLTHPDLGVPLAPRMSSPNTALRRQQPWDVGSHGRS